MDILMCRMLIVYAIFQHNNILFYLIYILSKQMFFINSDQEKSADKVQ